MRSSMLIKCLVSVFLLLIRYRLTTERLSTSIETIDLPRLAPSLLILIGSCRMYYVFKIKAGIFRKSYRSCNRFAKQTISSSSRVWENVYSLFITMAFITNVGELQAVLNSCPSTRDCELLIESILISEEWIPIVYARLSELTAQEIPVSNLFHLSSSLISFVVVLVSTLPKQV